MFRQLRAILVLLSLLIAAPAQAGDPTVAYSPNDPEMNTAIDAARDSLDGFLGLYFDPATRFQAAALKIAIPADGGGAEHIYVVDIARDGRTHFVGTIDNDPVRLPQISLGDRYRFSRDQISDWNYFKDGKLHGAYTLRVMLPRMAKEQADQYRQILAPLPD